MNPNAIKPVETYYILSPKTKMIATIIKSDMGEWFFIEGSHYQMVTKNEVEACLGIAISNH